MPKPGYFRQYVTLDHKTSHKGQFFEIEIYTSPENWINKVSIDVWFVRIGQYLESESKKKKKLPLKLSKMKSLAMHIITQKLSFDIFMVRNIQNIFMEHDLYLMS